VTAAFLGAAEVVAMTPGSPANLFVVDDDLVVTRRVSPGGIVDLQRATSSALFS
jgi:hypothetical protein